MPGTWRDSTSPTISNSLIAGTSNFDLLNAVATTINAFGVCVSLNVGYSGTDNSTANILTGANASGKTKTINFGTGGASGSVTLIVIGSANGTSKIYNQGTSIFGINGNGIVPTDISLAGLGIVWNKGANASGATYFQNYRQGGPGGFVFELYDTNGISPSLLLAPLSIDGSGNSLFSGSIKSNSPTSGIGYSSVAGGSVTQITSKSTSVSINKICGKIISNTESLAAGSSKSFYVNNSTVEAGDTVILTSQGGTTSFYTATPFNVTSGQFAILLTNLPVGTTQSEAVTISYAVIKAASS